MSVNEVSWWLFNSHDPSTWSLREFSINCQTVLSKEAGQWIIVSSRFLYDQFIVLHAKPANNKTKHGAKSLETSV